MAQEPRRHNRVAAQVPVELEDGSKALTRDISPAGIYFVGSEKFAEGQPIEFTLEFENPADPSGKLLLSCNGKVVRVEEAGGRCGVAVAITESRLERRAQRRSPKRAKERDFG